MIMQDQVQSQSKRGIPALFPSIEGTGVKHFVSLSITITYVIWHVRCIVYLLIKLY